MSLKFSFVDEKIERKREREREREQTCRLVGDFNKVWLIDRVSTGGDGDAGKEGGLFLNCADSKVSVLDVAHSSLSLPLF